MNASALRCPPVVSADRLFSPTALDDPYPVLAELRAQSPVHHLLEQDLYLVVDHQAVRAAVGMPEVFSSNIVGVLQRGDTGVSFAAARSAGSDVLATADAPVHAAHRGLVRKRFDRRNVVQMKAEIDSLIEPRVAALVSSGGGDWMKSVAAHLPVRVIAGVLGLPPEDSDRLAAWSDNAVELLAGTTHDARMGEVTAGIVEFAGYLRGQLIARFSRCSGGISIIDSVAAAVTRDELTEDQGVLFLIQLVTAGSESTTSLIGNAVRILGLDADLQRDVRADPTRVSALVEEALRLESPFRGHFRVTTEPVQLAGFDLPDQARLMLLWGSANRDTTVFDQPDILSLDRPNAKAHNSFGSGIHFCIGAHLARLEAQCAVSALLDATTEFATINQASYVPSLFIRRLETLDLTLIASGSDD
ncbi:cytochrome P450 [Gordonia sp. CPCC 205333]|uniref:cytochrome P450 n=1 Tax=Gordonia sp. CPCC 205333 TaxID=3140790 RepID=UPI003AF3BA39